MKEPNEEVVLEHLPMLLNLSDFGVPASVIGFASAFRNPETKVGRIEIVINPDNSNLLDHLVEIADIKAIGFAGIMKRKEAREVS